VWKFLRLSAFCLAANASSDCLTVCTVNRMAASLITIDKLKALSPGQFENVVYDLVTSAGLRNAVWRTPGSDGGRDIEGEMETTDFSGFHVITKWYVECKRYASSVDWPTVWDKIAYADSHEAGYLLIVTTAMLSPQCKTEASNWNSKRRMPAVRYWDGTNLEQLLMHYPGILVKYDLAADTKLAPAAFMALAQQTSKVVQAAYGASEMANHDNAALEAASALAELLTVRIRDAETGGKFAKSPFVTLVDGFHWLKVSGNGAELGGFDRHGLRALFALLRHVTGTKTATAEVAPGVIRVTLPAGRLPSAAATTLLTEVSLWGDLEVRVEGQDFIISRRP